jgi:type I restriction enzyme S subunit
MRDGWVELSLGELTENTRPICYGVLKPGPQVEGGVPLVKITDMDKRILGPEGMQQISNELDHEFRRSRLEGGEVLLSIQGTVGRVAIAASTLEGANISRTIAVIDPDERLHNFFLMYVLEKIATQGDFDSAGSTRESLNISTIRDMKVLCPPLTEQKRIVDLISSVDSYIEALQRQLESVKRSRNALLHELLTAGGADWVETTLGEVSDVIDPHPSHRAPPVDDKGIPFIGIGDLRKTGDIDFAKARRVSRNILEEHKARYNRSEFLIGLGRVASIGMVVRLPDENTEYVVSPTLAVIKAKDVMGQFLVYLLEGPHSQEQFQRFKKGSTRESVGMQILRKIKVHVPPHSEQQRIVEIIKSIDDVSSTTSRALNESKIFRSCLLSELLSGEHEIPASYDKIIGAA